MSFLREFWEKVVHKLDQAAKSAPSGDGGANPSDADAVAVGSKPVDQAPASIWIEPLSKSCEKINGLLVVHVANTDRLEFRAAGKYADGSRRIPPDALAWSSSLSGLAAIEFPGCVSIDMGGLLGVEVTIEATHPASGVTGSIRFFLENKNPY